MELDDLELRDELVRRAALDQEARGALNKFINGAGSVIGNSPHEREAIRELERVDEQNTSWLLKVVSTIGWPTRSRVGDEAARAAWLLVQHADHDPVFQKTCLDQLRTLADDDVDQSLVAYLTDRVNLAHGLPQTYGTQVENHDGTWRPRTLEDPANVDQRRAAVGLSTLAEYLDIFNSGRHRRPNTEN